MSRFIVISLIVLSQGAFAALGDHEQAINSESIKLKSSQHGVERVSAQYSVHTMSTPIATIREYVDNNGQVFAVSWNGIKRPDLSVLLGQYFQEYNNIDSRRARDVSRHPVSVQTSKIMVRKGGHMRAITGLAILSERLPAGVNEGDLK